MTNREAVIWLINLTADIGKSEHRDLWHYEQALYEIREMLETQPEPWKGKTNVKKDITVCPDDYIVEHTKTDNIVSMTNDGTYRRCGADMRGERT